MKKLVAQGIKRVYLKPEDSAQLFQSRRLAAPWLRTRYPLPGCFSKSLSSFRLNRH